LADLFLRIQLKLIFLAALNSDLSSNNHMSLNSDL
jgi:hypothetical protein